MLKLKIFWTQACCYWFFKNFGWIQTTKITVVILHKTGINYAKRRKDELLWDEYFMGSIFVVLPPWGKNREYIPWNTSSVISPVGHSVLNPRYILFISLTLNLKENRKNVYFIYIVLRYIILKYHINLYIYSKFRYTLQTFYPSTATIFNNRIYSCCLYLHTVQVTANKKKWLIPIGLTAHLILFRICK